MRRLNVLGSLAVAVLLFGLVSPVAHGQTTAPNPSGRIATAEPVRPVSDIIGSWVLDSQSLRLGRIDNLLIDPSTGGVSYALVSTGGILGLRERLVAVPMSAFQYDLSGGDFVLGVDVQIFDQAPDMDRYGSLSTGDLGNDPVLRNFWNNYVPGISSTDSGSSAAAAGQNATNLPGSGLAASGLIQVGAAETFPSKTGLLRVTQLGAYSVQSCNTGTGNGTGGAGVGSSEAVTGANGAGVSNSTSGMTLGTVEDLMIDLRAARVVYAVLDVDNGGLSFAATDASSTGTAGIGRLILVPWQTLATDAASSMICFNLPASTLQNAPHTTGFAIPDTTKDGWDASVRSYWNTIPGAAMTSNATPAGAAANAASSTGTSALAGRGILTTGTGTIMQAKRIMGHAVDGSSGQQIGEFSDLLIASDSGQVLYAVVSYGGFLGVGGNEVAVPWGAVKYDETSNTFSVPTEQNALDAAPKFSGLGSNEADESAWEAAVQQYWQQRGLNGAVTGAAAAPLVRIDRIIGLNVVGSGQETLGDVTDLLINVDDGQVLYALVGTGGFLGVGQTAKAVPWDAFQYLTGGNAIVLNVTANDLKNAPDLNVSDLSEAPDTSWDANVQQYWQMKISR